MNKSYSTTNSRSVGDSVTYWASITPDAIALEAPNARPLTYAGLEAQISTTRQFLRDCQLRPKDTIGLVVPNGPETAVATLSCISVARCAPLNPGFRASELSHYLKDLRVSALIVDSEIGHVARDVALDLGIDTIELNRNKNNTAGIFTLDKLERTNSKVGSLDAMLFPFEKDIALLLHTSGTTSKPKIVPLTHLHLSASVSNITATLQLKERDRCMNVMPLFHVHGLVGNLMSSLHAGASVLCCPDFLSPQVLKWMRDFRVTWYSAVPTVHQAILERARDQQDVLDSISLRFIRSASSAIASNIQLELEQIFCAPVIEAYGMTEAAHQIAANPLPPEKRKPGSVGRSTGTEISIVSSCNETLQANRTGEVLIRGNNVIRGYLDNKDANQTDFIDGWLKTGDEGYVDEDGYLFLTGRTKEMINRGGEKVNPSEVDEVLLQHPNITQAVTFSIQDERVGEEVAAAVVLNPNDSVSIGDLQNFVSERLADFKVPRRIEIVEKIPTGPTGKIQRITMAESLGVTSELEVKQKGDIEGSGTLALIREIWADVLELDNVDLDTNFFALGGDSVLGGMVIARIVKIFNIELNVITLFNSPTVRELAAYIDANFPVETAEITVSQESSEVSPNIHKEALAAHITRVNTPGELITGHRLTAATLKQLGVTHIYGLTGTPVNETFAHCTEVGIRVLSVHNQSAGAQMAAAQNYAAGRLVAATMMTPGPGMANAAMGALVAKDNGWPLLLIGGGRPQGQRLDGVFQDFDSVKMFEPLTKLSATVNSIQRLPWFIHKALMVSVNGRPGPVYLDIPEDVLTTSVDSTSVTSVQNITVSRPGPNPELLAKAVKLLDDAERPILFLDMEVRWDLEDFPLITTFVDKLRCPFITTHMARGYVSDAHPLCCNRSVSRACKDADLVLLLGGKLDWQFRFGSEINDEATILQVCSEPEDVGIGRAPELVLVGSPSEALKQLIASIAQNDVQRKDRSQWIDELKQFRVDAVTKITDLASRDDIPMIPERLVGEIKPIIPEDAVVIADGNASYGAVQRIIPALRPLSRLTPGPNGCIGVGIPYGIGVKMAQPEKPVVIITGDTAFSMSAMEIETAVRHKIDLVIIIANNSCPSAGKSYRLFRADIADEVAMFQHNIPFHTVAEALGARGEEVVDPEQVKPALLRAFEAEGVTCINAEVAPFTPIKLR